MWQKMVNKGENKMTTDKKLEKKYHLKIIVQHNEPDEAKVGELLNDKMNKAGFIKLDGCDLNPYVIVQCQFCGQLRDPSYANCPECSKGDFDEPDEKQEKENNYRFNQFIYNILKQDFPDIFIKSLEQEKK